MQRAGLAARRFYRAFYQWNLLIAHTERGRPFPTTCASAFHSSGPYHERSRTRFQRSLSRRSDAGHISLKDLSVNRDQQRELDDGGIQTSQFTIRRHEVYGRPPDGHDISRLQDIQSRVQESEHKDNGSLVWNKPSGGRAPDRRDVPQAMLEGEVVSAAVKPFHKMAADEYVVRFRSESGLMLEYAIAGDILQKAQERYGARLERLKARTGARIEVQELIKNQDGADYIKPHNMIHSVLISGTFKEVMQAFDDLKSNAEAPAVKRDKPVKPQEDGSNRRSSSGDRIAQFFARKPVQSSSELPSSDLLPGQTVVRSRSEDHVAVECSVDAKKFARWKVRFGEQLEYLKWRHGGDITVKQFINTQKTNEGQGESQPASEASSSLYYTVLVAGVRETVARIWDHLSGGTDHLPPDAGTPSSVPSEDLLPGNSVFRQVPGMDATLELAATHSQLQRLMAETEFASLAKSLKTSFSTKTSKLRLTKSAANVIHGHLITLAGPKEALFTMRTAFKLIHNQLQSPGGNEEQVQAQERTRIDEDQPKDKVSGGDDQATFTSLVEACPPDEEYQEVRRYVFARSKTMRRRARVSLLISRRVSRSGLCVITGTEDHVRRAKEMMLEFLGEAYQKFDIPPRGIRVVHERRDWVPSWPEVHQIMTQLTGGETQDQSHESLKPLINALYRCDVHVLGHKKRDVMDGVQRVSPLKQLKADIGCQDIAISKDAFIAHGSLPSVMKFGRVIREAIEKVRRSLDWPEIRVDSHVHASLSSLWARMTSIDGQDSWNPERHFQLAEDVRIALRPLSHPVVLITSRIPSFNIGEDTKYTESDNTTQLGPEVPEDSISRCRGVTVSSFNTVAMRPQPLVSFNIKTPSSSWDAISASGDLRIHLLTATSTGAAIADTFTKRLPHPYSGFLRLEKMGIDVTYSNEDAPPRVTDHKGVLAELHAKLMPEHCVKAGDHIIVVARVDSCRLAGGENARTPSQMDAQFWDSTGSLAYAKQEYRNVGAKIWQEGAARLPEDLPDPLSLGDEFVEEEASRTPSTLDVGQRKHREVQRSPNDGQAAAKSRDEDDYEKAMGMYDEELSPAVKEEEDDYDFGFETPKYGVKREHRSSPFTEESDEAHASDALWGSEDVVREDSIRLGGGSNTEPGVDSSHEADKPDGETYRPTSPNAKPSRSRSFATLSRPGVLHARTAKHFSTKARMASESTSHGIDIDQLIEPSARNMNVADYLGVPENARLHAHRARSLFRMNKDARRAEKQLLERDTELTEEDKAELRHKITTNDRIISKKLAWNAAYHLRIMLDKGRVDFKRAQFLESAVEKGQAILLEEATLVRDMYNQGKISFDRFQMVKEKLARDADVYQTELTRLGQIVDEEGDAGAVFPGAEEEGSGDAFDGFRGNR